MKKLTAKQQRFVAEFLVDGNATQAAVRAGYSKLGARQIGSENLNKPYLAEAIARAQQRRSERTEISQDRVLRELARIGFANILDYVAPNTDQKASVRGASVDLSNISRDMAAAISEVQIDQMAKQITRTKFKLHDKLSALDKIAKHLGMYIDRKELSGPNGGPIPLLSDLSTLTTAELKQMRDIQRNAARRAAAT